MHKFYLCIALALLTQFCIGQQIVTGKIIDDNTGLPVEGATITLLSNNRSAFTDETGRFIFKGKFSPGDLALVYSMGYTSQTFRLSDAKTLRLLPRQVQLADVVVVANGGNQYKVISKSDIALRGVSNSQEVLRIIPGIVIAQHQGGGKAEQIFLRGFDADHGTDFRLDVDGLPINMVSHAHGQGFADSHFIIPETIESVDYKKGPYSAAKGDFATTGFVDFRTKDYLERNTVKVEAGRFNTYRALAMLNLLSAKAQQQQQSWYVASEYRYSDAYFDAPQHFKRFNLFTKYSGRISPRSYLTASATTFWSRWNASGQIPNRAVEEHLIGFYGAIDSTEGGLTYRTNANVQLVTSLPNGGVIKNQVYYSTSHFDLHTNFTFFLVDPTNGDQIRQREARSLAGYNGSYQHSGYLGDTKALTEAGLQVRYDAIQNSELSHTRNRFVVLDPIKLGNIQEMSISPYVSETLTVSERLTLNAGLRLDQFFFRYNNKFAADTTLPGTGMYRARAATVSPKLNLYYQLNDRTQLYVAAGQGISQQ